MKKKSFFKKIATLAVVALLAFGAFFTTTGLSASAAESTLFTINGVSVSCDYAEHTGVTGKKFLRLAPTLSLNNENAVTVKFQRNFAINDAEFSFYLSEKLQTVEFVFKTKPFYVNGDKQSDGSYKADVVENVVKITGSGVTLNDAETKSATYDASTPVVFYTNVDKDGKFAVSLGKSAFATEKMTAEEGKLVENYDKTVTSSQVEIRLTYDTLTNDEKSAKTEGLDFIYIDQMASDASAKHKQLLYIEGTQTSPDKAVPVVDLNEGYKIKDGKIQVRTSKTFGSSATSASYSISYSSYTILSQSVSTKICSETVGNYYRVDGKTVTFLTAGDHEVKIVSYELDAQTKEATVKEVFETYTFTAVDELPDTAPEYVENETALEGFKAALQKATVAEYSLSTEEAAAQNIDAAHGYEILETTDTVVRFKASVRLGANQSLTIPSLKDLVSDSLLAYEKLTPTVHYIVRDSSSGWKTASSMSIPLTEEGTYYFYVTFKGINETDADKFVDSEEFPEDFTDADFLTAHPYGKYVFTFSVKDNAPKEVKAAAQEDWSVDAKNTAVSFDIAVGPALEKTVYNLYYYTGSGDAKTDTDQNHFVEIAAFDSAKDEGDYASYFAKIHDYFTYDELKAMGYDGTLTFTPKKIGTYKFTCTAYTTSPLTVTSAETYVYAAKSKVVSDEKSWLEQNALSVVFLSIGVLALGGIIALLLIKPKDEEVDA